MQQMIQSKDVKDEPYALLQVVHIVYLRRSDAGSAGTLQTRRARGETLDKDEGMGDSPE